MWLPSEEKIKRQELLRKTSKIRFFFSALLAIELCFLEFSLENDEYVLFCIFEVIKSLSNPRNPFKSQNSPEIPFRELRKPAVLAKKFSTKTLTKDFTDKPNENSFCNNKSVRYIAILKKT